MIKIQTTEILKPIPLLFTDEITITPVQELSYSDAKREIQAYIQKKKSQKVYISEIAEELVIDLDLIGKILMDIEKEQIED